MTGSGSIQKVNGVRTDAKNCVAWTQLSNRTTAPQSLYGINSESDEELQEKLEQQIGQVAITGNPERQIREEGAYQGSPLSWHSVVQRFEEYIEDKEGLSHILQNDKGQRISIDNSHRFEEAYQDRQIAEMYEAGRQAKQRYESLTTVMITLSASPFTDDNEVLNPIDHLDSLLDPNVGSWSNVKAQISRVLSDYDYEYMRVLEPHTPDKGLYATSGYAHQHLAIFINDPDDEIEISDFDSVVKRHIEHCETAEHDAHKNSVSVQQEEEDDNDIGAYLTAYLGEQIDEDPRNADMWFKRFLSLLWVSNRQRVNLSNTLNEWVSLARDEHQEEEDEDEEEEEQQNWEYVGVETAEGELIEVDHNYSGSYTTTIETTMYGTYDVVNFAKYSDD